MAHCPNLKSGAGREVREKKLETTLPSACTANLLLQTSVMRRALKTYGKLFTVITTSLEGEEHGPEAGFFIPGLNSWEMPQGEYRGVTTVLATGQEAELWTCCCRGCSPISAGNTWHGKGQTMASDTMMLVETAFPFRSDSRTNIRFMTTLCRKPFSTTTPSDGSVRRFSCRDTLSNQVSLASGTSHRPFPTWIVQ